MRKVLFVLFVACLARPAAADTAYGTPNWTDLLDVTFKASGSDVSTSTGKVMLQVGAVTSPGPAGTLQNMGFLANQSWNVFCIDLKNGAAATTFNLVTLDKAPTPPAYGQVGPMGAAKASAIAKMWSASIGNALNTVFNTQAFQLAIWEIVNETGAAYDITTGSFYMNGGTANSNAMKSKVAEYLSWATVSNAAEANLWAFQSGDPNWKQDFVGGKVPSPAAVIQLLGLGGMLGMVGLLRRRRR